MNLQFKSLANIRVVSNVVASQICYSRKQRNIRHRNRLGRVIWVEKQDNLIHTRDERRSATGQRVEEKRPLQE